MSEIGCVAGPGSDSDAAMGTRLTRRRTFTYADTLGVYMYFFQVVNGGLAKATTINGNTCTLTTTGYMVCLGPVSAAPA